ncbi:hypothetical protein DPMN_180971 [Dreissena polymorpha]|uniref:RLR CTR domain-containing protein n=1 Tax=Dreissena polymorpha TaxID=45954 RepID=A0A9D4I4V6_DREPO|nr:hypothetical protein DPMN_180971 [Dreissena polymorpha]
MGDEKQLEQETINAYKADMMYKAIEELKKIDARGVEHKVKIFQTEEIRKYWCKKDYESSKKSPRAKDDLEILCKQCSVVVCLVSEVRKIGSQHFVIAKDFPSKVTTKPHNYPKKFGVFEKKFKMYCKECPSDWRIVADRRGENRF